MNKRLNALNALMIFFSVIVSSELLADENNVSFSSGNKNISFADTLVLVLADNTQLAIDDLAIEKADLKVKELWREFLPHFDLNIDNRYTKLSDEFTGVDVVASFEGEDIPVSIERVNPDYSLEGVVEGTYSLYDGGERSSNYQNATIEKNKALLHKQRTKQLLLKDAALNFWDLYIQNLFVAEAKNALRLSEIEHEMAKHKFKNQQLSEVALTDTQLNFLRQQKRVKKSIRILAEVFNHYNSKVNSIYSWDSFQLEPITLQEMRSVANSYSVNAELEKELHYLDVRIADSEKKLQKSEFRPQVELYSAYRLIGRDDDSLDGVYSDFHGESLSLGVRMKWNIYQGGRSKYANRRSERQRSIALMKLSQIARDRDHQKQNLMILFDELRSECELSRQISFLNGKKVALQKRKFDQGELSLLMFEKVKSEALGSDIDEQIVKAHIMRLYAESLFSGVELPLIDQFTRDSGENSGACPI